MQQVLCQVPGIVNKTDKSPSLHEINMLRKRKIIHEIRIMCIVSQMVVSAKEKSQAGKERGSVPTGLMDWLYI